MNSKQIKMTSATVGTFALLAMGAFGLAGGTSVAQEEEEPTPPGQVTTTEITTGETVTDTVVSEAPETSVATPPITTPPSTITTGEA